MLNFSLFEKYVVLYNYSQIDYNTNTQTQTQTQINFGIRKMSNVKTKPHIEKDTSRENSIPRDLQHRLIFEAALLEPTYYLETVPNLLNIFIGVKMTWMTGFNGPYNGNDNTWTFKSRANSLEDANKLKDYFGTGEVTTFDTIHMTEYYWEADIDIDK